MRFHHLDEKGIPPRSMSTVEQLAEENGRRQMQNAVLRWLLANRNEVGEQVIAALITHMENHAQNP